MIVEGIGDLFASSYDVCIVGAGPVGICLALELEKCGLGVTLIESGVQGRSDAQSLSEAVLVDPRRHADMAVAVQRSLGGTSNLWGGGCLPLDPIDFEPQPFRDGAPWPLSHAEFAACLPDACGYADCGPAHFAHPVSDVTVPDGRFRADALIRYARTPSFGIAHAARLKASVDITVYLGATVTGLDFREDGRIAGIRVATADGKTGKVEATAIVLACGGVETARLLLNAQTEAPQRFGGPDGPLGRYYMGHLSGEIADIRLHSAALDRGFDFHVGDGRAYARRRFTASADLQRREVLTNIAFWPVLPIFRNAAHRDPVLSLAYLVLACPPAGRLVVSEAIRRVCVGSEPVAKLPHLLNVLGGFPEIARFLPRFLYRRFLADPRLPGLHMRNRARRYGLHYHAEHMPNPRSRIRLGEDRDRLGSRKAVIDIRFSQADADAVVRTHDHLAAWLAATGLGEVLWYAAPEERASAVLEQATDGIHQIGTVRMARSSREGVLDRDCRVFGSANLFVAGSAVFPTSGQANPTLSAIALGTRLARRIGADLVRPIDVPASRQYG